MHRCCTVMKTLLPLQIAALHIAITQHKVATAACSCSTEYMHFLMNTDLHQRSGLHTHSAVLMLLSYMERHIFVLQYISAMRAAAKRLHYEDAAAH
jgi:hypothetical protein